MNITEIPINKLKEIELNDIVILHHGFEIYNRDYHFIVESNTKENIGVFKILFTHCFDLKYRHKIVDIKFPDKVRKSWDDYLISPDLPEEYDGYWWGQGFTTAYPGFSYDSDCLKAKKMTEITNRPMYSVNLETDHYLIDFIFHDFKYEFLNQDSSISDRINIPIKNC
jgi:hypothetical protein